MTYEKTWSIMTVKG